jgi:mycothiol synthase
VPPPRAARYGLSLRSLAGREIEVRPARPTDAAAVADLLNAHARARQGEPTTTEAEEAHWLGLPAYVFWVAEEGGSVVAYAAAAERAERTRYWLDLRALEAEPAEATLAAAESWAAGRAAPGAKLFVTAMAADDTLRGFYEAGGHRLVRYEFEMRIDLDDELPAPDWPDGLTVRPFRVGEDDERVWLADQEAFADHWEHAPDPLEDWRRQILGHPSFDPSLFFVVEEGEDVAGLAFCIVRELDEPVGWVDILGVRQAWRRRGLGLALLLHAFREFHARELRQAGLEVDAENLSGAVRLYERAGMRVVREAVIYEKRLT